MTDFTVWLYQIYVERVFLNYFFLLRVFILVKIIYSPSFDNAFGNFWNNLLDFFCIVVKQEIIWICYSSKDFFFCFSVRLVCCFCIWIVFSWFYSPVGFNKSKVEGDVACFVYYWFKCMKDIKRSHLPTFRSNYSLISTIMSSDSI